METRKDLKHKPIIEVTGYDAIDGKYAPDTDAMCLSLGLAQWDSPEGKDISAKVWRVKKDGRISRQSEELPPHRAIDLTILIALTHAAIANGTNLADASQSVYDDVLKKINGSQYDTKNETQAKHLYFETLFEKDYKDYYEPRLKHISKILKKLGY